MPRQPPRQLVTAGRDRGAGRPPGRGSSAGGVLDADSRGLPVVADTESSTLLVRVPRDVEALRASAGPGARRWRMAVREVPGGLIDGGGAVTGFDRSGWYVMCRGPRTGVPR